MKILKALKALNAFNNLDWVLPLLVVVCVASYVAVWFIAFMSGVAAADTSCHFRISLTRADLEISNAKLDRMEAWTQDCRVTFSAPLPDGKKFATMICPDSTVLHID